MPFRKHQILGLYDQGICQCVMMSRGWAKQWLVNINHAKTKFMVLSKKLNRIDYGPLFLDGVILDRVESHCQHGITFNDNMSLIGQSHQRRKHQVI